MLDSYRSRIAFAPIPGGVCQPVFTLFLSLALPRLSRGRRA